MKTALPRNHVRALTSPRFGGRIRLSAKQLLAAGALCVATPAWAAVVTNAGQFSAALNNILDEDIVITGGDIDLTGLTFTVSVNRTQFFGDGTTRTLTGGDLTLTSPNDTNYNILTINPAVIWDGDLTLSDFARIDLDAPTVLGASATLTAAASAEIRLFTSTGTSTFDTTFWSKVTGVDDETTIAFVADGEAILTDLPTFDARINLDPYSDFEFSTAPLTDPLVTLGATLAGNHDVTINAGTLDLDDFDFTIDSLAGVEDTEVTLGTGTLTTGDDSDTEYAGVISGTGDLTKTGTGTFTLSGVNTYTGTTTVTAGTLALDADQTGPTAVLIQSGATVVVNADQTGTPAYTVQSGGTLSLNGDLVDTTDITIDAGSQLNLNDLSQTFATLSGGGNISLGEAALTLGDATDFALAGVISGTGSLTKVGSGNLTLSGVNTYTGPTTISAGTLTLDGDLANTSTVIIAGAATLDLNDNNETLGTISGAGNITLGTATLTVGNSTNFTFGGTISEAGGLTKQGTGTMTFSGAQTYTGSTLINGGTLVANDDMATSDVTVASGATFVLESTLTNADVTVDDGGTLYGTGTIGDDLTNNGTVTFLGAGAGDTLTVNGNYTQGATGLLEVQIGTAGGLAVTGNATLDGTLNIEGPADPANFDINATYDVFTAGGGIAGNFSTVNSDFIFLDLTSTVNGGDIEITLARNATALADIARTTNQTTIANVLDGIGAPTGELEAVINRILASSETQALATYDQLVGAGAATASTQMAAAAVTQSHRVLDQVIGITPGSSRPLGAFGQAPSTGAFDEADDLTLFSFYQGAVEEEESKPQIAGMTPSPWGTFYGGFGDQGEGAEGLDYNRYGLITGLELESAESKARYGVSLGVEQSDFEFNRDNGEVDIMSLYLSGYTRQPLVNNWFFTFTGGVGYHNHDSTRNILIGVTPTQASADFDSFSVSLAAELSRTFDITRTPIDPGNHPTVTSIEPFARLDYSISDQDGYSETGAGNAGLVVEDSEYDSTRASFGVRVQHQYMFLNRHEAVFQARGLVSTALSNSDSGLNVSFVNTPGTSFAIEGSDQDDLYGQVGIGLSVELNDRWDLNLDVDQQFSDSAKATVIAAGLRYSF